MTTPNSLAPPAPANGRADLAALYDVHDPVHEYTVPDAIANPATPARPVAATPGVTAAATTPVATPALQPAPTVTPALSPTGSPAPALAPRHPAWLMEKAATLGLHPLLSERLSTEDFTQLVVGELSKFASANAQASAAAAIQGRATPAEAPIHPQTPGNPAAAAASPATPPAAAAANPSAPQAWDWGVWDDTDDAGRPIKKQYTDADVHPAVGNHIKLQAARIAKLEGQLAAITQREQAAGQTAHERTVDAAFAKLGGIFGTQAARQMPAGSPELERRKTVYAAVKGMYAALEPAAREALPLEQAVFTMAKSLFGVAGPAAAAGTPTPEQYVSGTLQPPTQRRGNDQPLGRDRAVEEATAWWKENQAAGAIPANGGTSMDEFLP